jgi:hypothetical protein
MRSTGTQNRVPEVPADQLALNRALKHLRKLRWIGKELEVQEILQVLDHKLRPLASRRSAQAGTSPVGQLSGPPLA